MDEQKSQNWGGKRKGAGRKKQPTTKYPLTFYLRKGQELVFGSKEKMKAKVYEFIENYGNETPIAPTARELPQQTTYHEPYQTSGIATYKRRTYQQYIDWKLEINNEEEYRTEFLPALNADKWLSPKEKQSIKIL